MYVKEALIRHELNRIHSLMPGCSNEFVDQAKNKIELLHDLDIIDFNQYMFEFDRLDQIKRMNEEM